MNRAAVSVREAVAEDIPVLLDMWTDLRHHAVRRNTRASSDQLLAEVAHRFVEAIVDPSCRLVVAVAGDVVLGMALFTVVSSSTLLDVPTVHASHIYVVDGHRGRGVGKSLIAAAAVFAGERGVDQVMVSVAPGLREANRFYARLGFAPTVVRRVAPLSVLRRQLAADEPTGPGVPGVLRRELRLRRSALVGGTRVSETAGRASREGH
ncbi:MAG: GNAT family N-acetyltransferase [Actinomycetota bacterium]